MRSGLSPMTSRWIAVRRDWAYVYSQKTCDCAKESRACTLTQWFGGNFKHHSMSRMSDLAEISGPIENNDCDRAA